MWAYWSVQFNPDLRQALQFRNVFARSCGDVFTTLARATNIALTFLYRPVGNGLTVPFRIYIPNGTKRGWPAALPFNDILMRRDDGRARNSPARWWAMEAADGVSFLRSRAGSLAS